MPPKHAVHLKTQPTHLGQLVQRRWFAKREHSHHPVIQGTHPDITRCCDSQAFRMVACWQDTGPARCIVKDGKGTLTAVDGLMGGGRMGCVEKIGS